MCAVEGSRIIPVTSDPYGRQVRVRLVCTDPQRHSGKHYDDAFALEFGQGLGVAEDDDA